MESSLPIELLKNHFIEEWLLTEGLIKTSTSLTPFSNGVLFKAVQQMSELRMSFLTKVAQDGDKIKTDFKENF
jgi:hypothetical protein